VHNDTGHFSLHIAAGQTNVRHSLLKWQIILLWQMLPRETDKHVRTQRRTLHMR